MLVEANNYKLRTNNKNFNIGVVPYRIQMNSELLLIQDCHLYT